MINLLKETKKAIKNSGHKPNDIIFIGSEKSGHSCSWGEFTQLADIEYDAGFGWREVASDLIIVFVDGTQMWRGEYDGSEWWEYSKSFKAPEHTIPITRLVITSDHNGWTSLAELNDG